MWVFFYEKNGVEKGRGRGKKVILSWAAYDSPVPLKFCTEFFQSFTVAVELWQWWRDPRLTYPAWAGSRYQVLDSTWITKLWNPNLYFPNAVDGKIDNIITPSSFFWMSQDSDIYFCCRYWLFWDNLIQTA